MRMTIECQKFGKRFVKSDLSEQRSATDKEFEKVGKKVAFQMWSDSLGKNWKGISFGWDEAPQ